MEGADSWGLVGELLDGKYRVDQPVAEGGFGLVYAGHQLRLDVPVAIKFMRPTAALRPRERAQMVASFLEEAKTMARLKHPNIAQVLDAGVLYTERVAEGLPWTIFEWLEGETLASELLSRRGRGGRNPREVWKLMHPVLDAIAFAHEAGVAHRDLKPANIMLVSVRGSASPRVLDFGVAKLIDPGGDGGSGETRTRSALTAFSPSYAAPEQVSSARTGLFTDVHALSLILTELLTDQTPYPKGDNLELHARVLDRARPTPKSLGVDVGAWEQVLAKATALVPRERYQSAGELRSALESALEGATHRHSPGFAPAEPEAKVPSGNTERTAGGVGNLAPRRSGARRFSRAGAISFFLAAAGMAAVVANGVQPSGPSGAQSAAPAPAANASAAPTIRARERRLTSVGSAQAAAVIAPDGRRIASIDDQDRLMIRDLTSARTSYVPIPSGRKPTLVSWFPDGKRLLVQETRNTMDQGSSLWAVSLDGSHVRIAEPAGSGIVSPDGARVAYALEGELWLLNLATQQRKQLMHVPLFVAPLAWSPDGRWLLVGSGRLGEQFRLIDTTGSLGTRPLPSEARLTTPDGSLSAVWHPNGHLVFPMADSPPLERGANLYALAVDAELGEARGKPVKLTAWSGITPHQLSLTSDGKIVVVKGAAVSDVHVGTLTAGGRKLANVRMLTHDERSERPSGWLPDGRGVLVTAEPTGRWSIFRANLADGALIPLTSETKMLTWPEPGPDQDHFLYFRIEARDGGKAWQATLVKMPLEGGAATDILTRSTEQPGPGRPPPGDLLVSCVPRLRKCALVELIEQTATIRALEPDGRLGSPVAHVPATDVSDIALSPDGSELALAGFDRALRVSMLTGNVHPLPMLNATEPCRVQYVAWSPTGDGLFASCLVLYDGSRVFHIDKRGRIDVLARSIGWLAQPVPSADGKHLAWLEMRYGGDAWELDLEIEP